MDDILDMCPDGWDMDEKQAIKNGRRNRLTADQFNEWAGSDDGATREFVVELLLDIVNGVYAIDDFLSDVKQYE